LINNVNKYGGAKLSVKRIDHLGVAVKNIDEALNFYRDSLGLELECIEEIPERGLKVAFIKVGESRIELLESISEKSTVGKYIEKKGEGIHHLAVNVENIEESMNNIREKGYKLLSEKPENGAGGTKVAFIHPKSTNGVLMELVQGNH